MTRFTKQGFEAPAGAAAALGEEFRRRQFVRLPGLLEGELLNRALDLIDQSSWHSKTRKDFDSEFVLGSSVGFDMLHFLANAPSFLRFVHQVTGTEPLTWFEGWVYRMAPNAGHHDGWHSDNVDGRLIAMSVNLSRVPYAGGRFQMRPVDSDRVLVDITNTGLGDATLFRVSDRFVHRVTDVQGDQPKTSFAGWFHANESNLRDKLRSLPPRARITGENHN